MAQCPYCGVNEEEISVPDAIVAIRTLPRRYREALARIPPDALNLRPDPSSVSALEAADRARSELERLAHDLPVVLDDPGVHLPSFDLDQRAPHAPDAVPDLELVLAGIAHSTDALVARAEATPWEAWERPFTAGAEPHVASWIVQHAAHVGAHHLREIERIRRLVGAPDDD
jgi:hypothetical protein